MQDLTAEEERALPLPPGWGPCATTDGTGVHYKNTRTGLVTEEHPFVLQALNVARKLPLPEGWSIKEAFLSDGSKDLFYTNDRLGISMWDPPALRHCLADCLGAAGFSAESIWILNGTGPPMKGKGKPAQVAVNQAVAASANQAINDRRMQSVQDAYLQFQKSGLQTASRHVALEAKPLPVMSAATTVRRKSEAVVQQRDETKEEEGEDEGAAMLAVSTRPFTRSNEEPPPPPPPLPQQQMKRQSMQSTEEVAAASTARRPSMLAVATSPSAASVASADNFGSPHSYAASEAPSQGDQSNLTLPSSIASITGIRSRSGKWESLRSNIAKEAVPAMQPQTHTSVTVPPKSVSGLRILKQDVAEANTRVHELIMKLRAELCARENMPCTVIDQRTIPVKRQHYNYGEDKSVENSDFGGSKSTTVVATYTSGEMVALAADIMSELRHHPEHIICAMACCTPGSVGMPQIAFTALHRLLHPFSSDNSMTTAILLQGINFQVEECAHLEEMFPEFDARQLLSRAMFVADPEIAVGWNPLAQPMPVVPSVSSETVLTCLLRMYAIRRDVTSYFRTIWRPLLPSIIHVISSNDIDGSLTFSNIVTVAYRLLEVTLKEQSMTLFPPIATAMCRAIFEIGGSPALHNYLFNLLILPNMLKIFGGRHDSVENEMPVRFDKTGDFSVQFFDIDSWWPVEGFANAPFSSLSTLVWCAWRFYSAASTIDAKTLAALKAADFFTGGPRLDMSGLPDQRLRSLIWHLQRRISEGCGRLLKMPLDLHGSEFLGLDMHNPLAGLADLSALPSGSVQLKMLEQRLSALLLKPDDMLTLTVVGRHEIADLFSDVGIAMEAVGSAHDSHGFAPLHRAITEYLVINDEFGDEVGEELVLVPFEFAPEGLGGYDDKPNNGLRATGGRSPRSVEFAMTDETIHYRHRQLRRGLALSNRYEASLLRMLTNLRRHDGESPTCFDLIEDEVMYVEPEFDVDFKASSKVGIDSRMTENWKNKVKRNLLGMKEAQKVLVHPSSLPFDSLVAPALQMDWQKDHSERVVFENAHKALRFHSTHTSTAVGTSMARPKVQAPKLAVQTALIQTARGRSVKRTKRGHTKVSVRPEASFLEATESSMLHTREEKYRPPADQSRLYLESLRSDEIRDPESFQRNRRKHLGQSKGSSSRDQAGVPSTVKPFPEHLRGRIRREAGDEAVAGHSMLDEEDDDEDEEQSEDDLDALTGGPGGEEEDNIQALLREYQELFGNTDPGPRGGMSRARSAGRDPSLPRRSRSPSPDHNQDHSRSLTSAYYRRARRPDPTVHPDHPANQPPDAGRSRSRSPPRPAFKPAGSLNLDKNVYHTIRTLGARPDLPVEVDNAYSSARLRSPVAAAPASAPAPAHDPAAAHIAAPAHASREHVEAAPSAPGRGAAAHVAPSSDPAERRASGRGHARRSTGGAGTANRHHAHTHAGKEEPREEEKEEEREEEKEGETRDAEPSSKSPPARRMSTMQWLFNSAISPVRAFRARTQSGDSPTSDTPAAPVAENPGSAPVPASASAPTPAPIPTAAPGSVPREASSDAQKNPLPPSSDDGHAAKIPVPLFVPRRRSSVSASMSPIPEPAPVPMQRPVRASLHERRASLEADRARRASTSGAADQPAPPRPQAQPQQQQQQQTPSPSQHREQALIALRRQSYTSTEASGGLSPAASAPAASAGPEPEAGSSDEPAVPASQEAPAVPVSPRKPQIIKKASFVMRDKDQLRAMLVNGVTVVKHGKTGKPKLKTLLYKPEGAVLEWHDLGGKSRVGVFLGLSKAETVGSMPLGDITEVRRGTQTSVLVKARDVDPLKTLSLVSATRSLDIVMASMQDRDTMLRSIKAIMEENQKSPIFT